MTRIGNGRRRCSSPLWRQPEIASVLRQGTLVITDDGRVGRVRRCIGPERIEIVLESPAAATTLVWSRDIRFVRAGDATVTGGAVEF